MSLRSIDEAIRNTLFQPVANWLEWTFGWETQDVGKQLLLGLVAIEAIKGGFRITNGESFSWVIIQWLILVGCIAFITRMFNHAIQSDGRYYGSSGVFEYLRFVAVIMYLVFEIPDIIMMVLNVSDVTTVKVLGHIGQVMYVAGLYFLSCDRAPPRKRDDELVLTKAS